MIVLENSKYKQNLVRRSSVREKKIGPSGFIIIIIIIFKGSEGIE